ncbi:MAG: hypothetical protein WCI88_10170 [Chloroflexota bacterium]
MIAKKKYTHIKPFVFGLLISIALTHILVLSSKAGNESSLIEALKEQRQNLFSAHEVEFKSNTQHSIWLREFVDDIDSNVIRSGKDWNRALMRLVSLSKKDYVFHANSGFIEDRKTVELLITALGSADRDIRKVALKSLAWETRQKDLTHFQDLIKSRLSATMTENEFLLLGRLSLNQSEKIALLTHATKHPEIAARQGDSNVEQLLIGKFTSEHDYYEKSNLARQLGYIATRNCALALIEALSSNVSIKGVYDDRSIRCNVLLALGQIYQDEPLFTTDANLIADNGDDILESHYGKEKYVKAVDAWVRQHFGNSAWTTADIWFIRWHNIPNAQIEIKQ